MLSPTPTLDFPDIDFAYCSACGRMLTDPESVVEGMGPCCRRGKPYRPKYAIVVDTREQAPYFFDDIETVASRGSRPVEVELVVSGLKAGDYSIVGHEHEIAIERKSKEDLYGTLSGGRERFVRELERLREIGDIGFAAVVVECDLLSIRIPPERSSVPPQSIEGSILGLSMDFPSVQWVMCGSRRHAEKTVWWMLDRWYRRNVLRRGKGKVKGVRASDLF